MPLLYAHLVQIGLYGTNSTTFVENTTRRGEEKGYEGIAKTKGV
jgi:hypothetical protein